MMARARYNRYKGLGEMNPEPALGDDNGPEDEEC